MHQGGSYYQALCFESGRQMITAGNVDIETFHFNSELILGSLNEDDEDIAQSNLAQLKLHLLYLVML